MRVAGKFNHVTSTRILKPTSDRAYFYLVYGTRHPKGLIEFRGVERQGVEEQERVRLEAKQQGRVARTGQSEMFRAASTGGPPSFDDERRRRLETAESRLDDLLRPELRYEDALSALLELPLVWEGDVKEMIMRRRSAGQLEVKGMKRNERTPKAGHVLVRVPRTSP